MTAPADAGLDALPAAAIEALVRGCPPTHVHALTPEQIGQNLELLRRARLLQLEPPADRC